MYTRQLAHFFASFGCLRLRTVSGVAFRFHGLFFWHQLARKGEVASSTQIFHLGADPLLIIASPAALSAS